MLHTYVSYRIWQDSSIDFDVHTVCMLQDVAVRHCMFWSNMLLEYYIRL